MIERPVCWERTDPHHVSGTGPEGPGGVACVVGPDAEPVRVPRKPAIGAVGEFDGCDRRLQPLRSCESSGARDLFAPGVRSKRELRRRERERQQGADPFAFPGGAPPRIVSIAAETQAWTARDRLLHRDESIPQARAHRELDERRRELARAAHVPRDPGELVADADSMSVRTGR